MISPIGSFSFQESKETFERSDGSTLPKTAILVLAGIDGFGGESLTYGLPNLETIYTIIKEGKPLNFDECFIHNFSIEDYREWAGIPEREDVEIHDFSAENTIFSAKTTNNFSQCIFKGKTAHFKDARFLSGNVDFGKSQFQTESVDFTRVHFGPAKVSFLYTFFGEGSVNFNESDFGRGKVSFVNANFGSGKISFRSATFGEEETDFHFSKFGTGEKLFDKVTFRSRLVDFRKVEFGHGKIDFRWADFGHGRIVFDEADVASGKVTFNRCRMNAARFSWELGNAPNSDFTMEKSDLGQSTLSFAESVFQRLSLASCQFNNYIDLRVEKCTDLDLSNTVNRDLIDLKPDQKQIHVDRLYLIGMRNLGRIIVGWKSNNLLRLINDQPASSLWQKADQFRLLKEDFGSSGEYLDEDASYVAFKRMELKAELKETINANSLNALWAYPRSWFKWIVFDKMGLYATDPIRVLVSMSVIYVLFSLLYVILIPISSADIASSLDDPDHLSLVAKSFYHSAITFLTIGYGDYYPSGSIRWLSSLEGFVGLFLMSYFTVAFVRKILR